MADCESCKNYDRPTVCSTCENGSDFEEVAMSNADKIRSMSDEELAEFLHDYVNNTCSFCAGCETFSCKDNTFKWLQSEAE